jgi:hypothetical protein
MPVTVPPTSGGSIAVVVAVVVGALVAIALGVFGRVHDPRFFSINVAGFSGPMAVKAWLATAVVVLALFQLLSALIMYGRIPGVGAPAWIGPVHVWSGRLAVLVSVPVAVHCLYALGFQSSDLRVLIHSVLGCLFYGVFVTKMLLLTREGSKSWAVPVAGGLLFMTIVLVWLMSALWFFQTRGLTF